MSVKSVGLKSILMGYYLPPKSYLRPKPRVNIKQKIVAITTAGITLVLGGIIFTSMHIGENKSAVAGTPEKNNVDAILQAPLLNINPATTENINAYDNHQGLKFPVQLAYFKVIKNQHSLELKWSTTLEYKNEYFSLEKSPNGTDFYEVGCVDSKKNNELSSDYSFIDDDLSERVIFYRLRQVSTNDRSTFIALQKVSLNNENEDLSLYIEEIGPQPFEKYFNINYFTDRDGGVSVELFDKSGKKIYKSYTLANQGYNTCRFIEGEKLTDDEYTVRIANSSGAYVKKIKKRV